MSAGFSIGGLVSGIDTNQLVSQLMQIERIPITTMRREQASLQRAIDAFGGINTRLSALRDAMADLDTLGDFRKFAHATSSNEAVVIATATGEANPGTLTFRVDALASQHQLFGDDSFSSGGATVGAGDVTITVGGQDTVITTNAATTLNDLAAAINNSNIGVHASVVTKTTGDVRLVLNSADTGADAAFTVNSTAAGVTSFTETATAGNALITFGTGASAVTVERSTNTVSDLIDGVTLTLTGTSSSAVSVTTARDNDAVIDAVRDYVDALNAAISELDAATDYDPDTNTSGPLAGNSAARDLLDQLRSVASRPVDSLSGTYFYASSVGVEIQRDGTFTLNEARLREALDADYDAVADLFAATAAATDSRVSFVRSTGDTVAGTYDVNVTQVAQVASVIGGVALPPVGGDPAYFTIIAPNGESIDITVPAGSSASAVAGAVNAAMAAAGISNLVASVNTDTPGEERLQIETTSYGAGVSFTVDVENDAYGVNGTYTGVDVAGTINGQAATGKGRLLTSTAGDSEGLALEIAGDATGAYGQVTFSRGITGALDEMLQRFEGNEGLLTLASDSLQDSIDQYQERIEALETRLVLREEYLRRQFTAMEQAIAQITTQANFFAAQLGALQQ